MTVILPERPPPRKLLCLDGGGIKGISSLLTLEAIMKRVQELEDGTPVTEHDLLKPDSFVTVHSISDPRKPIDYFDLTGGTSTGGIIAVLLFRLGLGLPDAIRIYKEIAKEIFATRSLGHDIGRIPVIGNPLRKVVLDLKYLFGPQFDAAPLEKAIDHVLEQYDSGEGDPNEIKMVEKSPRPDGKGKMFMCSTVAVEGETILFRSYTPPNDAHPVSSAFLPAKPQYPDGPQYVQGVNDPFRFEDVTIKEACRATSAAPTYLPQETIQGIKFWDGGLLNNNPVDQVWAARYDLDPTQQDEPYVSLVLSLGTTWTDPDVLWNRKSWFSLVTTVYRTISITSNTEAKHRDFERNNRRRNKREAADRQTHYFRFNAPLGKTVVDLAEYERIDVIEEATKRYLTTDPKAIADIDACARLLARDHSSS